MPSVQLSFKAKWDYAGIYVYTARTWGIAQAKSYRDNLRATMDRLAEKPELGRSVGMLRPGYFQHRHVRHQIFYAKTGDGILIVRILHERMDFLRHL